ncbi:sensor histidine kinase [Luteimonas sp. A482]
MYQEAFARAGAGMALLAAGGEWLAVNPALCLLLGRDQAELAGTRAHEALFDAATVQRIGLALAGADMQQHINVDGIGGHAWRMSLAQLDSGASGVLLLQLEPDQDAQTRAAAARMQDHLVHGISHDLRAPLRGIAGFAARLDESTTVAEADRADIARIRKAAARAEHLVDALLELLRAARLSMREQEVDVSLLCEWVAGELQDADPSRTARIEVAPDLRARGDEHWLKTLLGHVLDNAWKFSAARECVDIRVEGAAANGLLQLAVHDAGCGFDMRYADKLFLPFQRLHGSEQGGGNGLGLAIAHQIAERHGGRMWATSRPGEGSTFFIELPAPTGRDLDAPP